MRHSLMTSALATLLACAGQTVLYAQEPIIRIQVHGRPCADGVQRHRVPLYVP